MKKRLIVVAILIVAFLSLGFIGPVAKPIAWADDDDDDGWLFDAINEIKSELSTISGNIEYLISLVEEEKEVIEWVGQPSNGFQLSSLQRVSQVIDTTSGGRLKLNVGAPGTYYPSPMEFDGVHEGAMDFAISNMHSWNNHFNGDLLELFCIRCGGLSPMGKYLWFNSGDGTDLMREMITGYNVHLEEGSALLGTPEVFLHSKYPITEPGDLVGLEIRTAGSSGVILTRMGAHCQFMPGGDIYEAMQTGVIDACEFSDPTVNWEYSLQEVAEYVYISGCRAPHLFSPFIVNEASWNALPDDLKLLVQEVTREEAIRHYSESVASDIEHLEMFRDYPCTVELLSPAVEEAFVQEANNFLGELAASDPFAARVLDSINAFEEELWETFGQCP